MRLTLAAECRFLILCIAILVSACTSLSTPAPTPGQALVPRPYQSQINMSGRLFAQYEKNDNPQSISVHFDWAQTPGQTLITLSSPTGQTVATIVINAQGAQLIQADKPPQIAADIDQLSENILGWPLPANGLHDWLQGFLDAKHATPVTKAMTDKAMLIDGWSLRYVSWQAEPNWERPKRLDLSHQTVQAGLVQIRIVVDEWVVP